MEKYKHAIEWILVRLIAFVILVGGLAILIAWFVYCCNMLRDPSSESNMWLGCGGILLEMFVLFCVYTSNLDV